MIFLSREEVLRFHAQLLALYGGEPGVRDEGLLASALSQPEASFEGQYLHEGVHAMAAAYAFHLAKNHAFVDGNKRVALAAMLAFLRVNGAPLRVPREELYLVMLRVADGRMGKQALIAWLRARATARLGGEPG